MKHNTPRLLFLGVLFAILISTTTSSGESYALATDANCAPVEAIFARGSGQDTQAGESERFKQQFELRITDTIGGHYYELGTETYNNYKYPATDIDNIWNGNPIGAKVSSGSAFDYGKSVNAGVGELTSYLTQRYEKCKANGSKYVLGGYSQGAQVIGQALSGLSAEIRSQIVFVALFGDPKLHLPEGEGVYPPACRGEDFSQWRRIIGNCHVDNGTLGARKPYLPADMQAKTGLWCYAKDAICGSSKNPLVTEGHGQYKLEGHAIDLAVGEIVEKLIAVLPAEQAQHLIPRQEVGSGTTGLDVVFLIDTTGSMYGQIEQAKAFARSSATRIQTLRGRVALVAYRDYGDAYTAKIVSHFSEDVSDFQTQLDTLTVDGGGDVPEATLHALMTAFNGLDWKYGSTKAAVILTDAGYHNPDIVDGSTEDTVAKRSLEIDPVNVYPVVPSHVMYEYSQLALKTSGQVIANTGNTAAALEQALTKIEQRPIALLKNMEYAAEIGQSIRFDASDSYVIDASITRYEWDFDGDGVFEESSTEPVATHTYENLFDGTMQVRLTASNGTIANASAFVKIGLMEEVTSLPAAPIHLSTSTLSTVNSKSAVQLSWQASDTLAHEWVISVNDVAVGRVTGDTRSIELTDIERSSDVTISVAGVSSAYEVGESTSVVVAKEMIAQPPVEPPKTPWYIKVIRWVIQIVRGWNWSW